MIQVPVIGFFVVVTFDEPFLAGDARHQIGVPELISANTYIPEMDQDIVVFNGILEVADYGNFKVFGSALALKFPVVKMGVCSKPDSHS
jgi:hypothetical protein